MGIHGLTKAIGDHASNAIKEYDIKQLNGMKVAIDASMCIYQFLIAIRSEGQVLQNVHGETTSHLVGMFSRTLRQIDNGIKPVYVFDGKPPVFKNIELQKRLERRNEAAKEIEEAKEIGNEETLNKFSKRFVKASKEHNEECKKLLRLMGIPYIEAPCEAEAQCAALCKANKVDFVSSEDMDTLTFGAPKLLRNLTASETKKLPIMEFNLDKILTGFNFTMNTFIDYCILLGCDYCSSIKGIGEKGAFKMLLESGSLEQVIANLDSKKFPLPEYFDYGNVRELFQNPEVTDPNTIELKWTSPNSEGLIAFLVDEKGFNKDRVLSGILRLEKGLKTATQNRLESFFKVVPRTIYSTNNASPKKELNKKLPSKKRVKLSKK